MILRMQKSQEVEGQEVGVSEIWAPDPKAACVKISTVKFLLSRSAVKKCSLVCLRGRLL